MGHGIRVTRKHHIHLNHPFPTKPKTLPFLTGSVFPQTHKINGDDFRIGRDFRLNWSQIDGGSISIFHNSQPEKSLWSTLPGKSFLSAAVADTEVEESRGSFAISDRKVHLFCNHQTIEDIRLIEGIDIVSNGCNKQRLPVVLIKGRVLSLKGLENRDDKSAVMDEEGSLEENLAAYAKYWVLFEQKNDHQVGFQVSFGKPVVVLSPKNIREAMVETVDSRDFNRICITYSSEKSERFYGFGEQFSHMDFKGREVPILVQEQGIGRGDQPITFAANMLSYRSGGDESTTYAPSPFYMTSKMRSLYLEGYNYSVFDLTRDDCVQIKVHGDTIEGRILYGNTPVELIERFTETIGRPQELPEWMISGAVVGMQGGTVAVRRILEKLQAYNTPISAFWLQDWVGERKTVIGSQLWWNWEVDSTRYSGWKKLIKDLSDHGIKVLTYCNPCLAPVEGKMNVQRNQFEEAKKLDIFVKDRQGRPYMVPNTAFDVGMLDLTNPRTECWFKQILATMVDDGVRGWMADFGEGLPVDACLYSGEDPITAHNRYPEIWATINREFVDEWKKNHQEDLVFFMRAGFRNSPNLASLFWEGDQMVSWQSNDGIKSAVVGLLSSGLSGYSFNHSDIGGYCAVQLPFLKYLRTEELLLRWMELNAFTTVFRTHEGNKPRINSQFYSNQRTLSHFSRFATIYKAWKFYRIQLVKEASEKGLPVCRHLFLHYPNDEHVQTLTYQQFLVGTEILVAPVLDKNRKVVQVYFPQGENSLGSMYGQEKCMLNKGLKSVLKLQ